MVLVGTRLLDFRLGMFKRRFRTALPKADMTEPRGLYLLASSGDIPVLRHEGRLCPRKETKFITFGMRPATAKASRET